MKKLNRASKIIWPIIKALMYLEKLLYQLADLIDTIKDWLFDKMWKETKEGNKKD